MARTTQYATSDGKVPFDRWFSSLGAKAAAKVTAAIAQMELGNFGDHKSVGGGVWERRINFEKGYRIYFAKDGEEIVLLLCGGTKSRQQSDIDAAKEYWQDYKKRKRQRLAEPTRKSGVQKHRRRKK